MDLVETITVRGDVSIKKIRISDGAIISEERKNLVVNNGKTILAKLLGGDASYKNLEHITKVGFGTSNTAAAAGQAALVAQVLTKDVTVSFPAFNQVKFSATMEANEGGTNTYYEYGLLSDGTAILFSRVVGGGIVKSSLYKIQVDWTISFQ